MLVEFEEREVKRLIPTKKVLIEFLEDHSRKYCPPWIDFTTKFGKKVLKGEKRLLDKKNVIYCSHIPKYHELSMKVLYKKIQKDKKFYRKV